MGNVCYSEYCDSADWKMEAIKECNKIDVQYAWKQQIVLKLSNLIVKRELLLRDIILMNATFQEKKLEMSSLEEDRVYRQSVKKFQRRTGMQETAQDSSHSFASSQGCDTQSCLYHEKSCQINFASKQSFQYFAHFTDIVKWQMKTNELGQMVEVFKFYYVQKDGEDKYNSFKLFSLLLYELIVSYYEILRFKQYLPKQTQLLNKDTLLNFTNNCLLQDQEIYNELYEWIGQHLSDKINKTKKLMANNQNITCAQAGVSKEFQYNDYSKAVDVLRKLKDKPGPASKSKVIIKLSKTITQCMSKNRGQSLVLASDDVMPVIKYVLIKSQLEDIDIHIFIMQNFLASNILSSSMGFFLTSLMAMLEP